MLHTEFYKIAGKNWADFYILLWENRVNRSAKSANDDSRTRDIFLIMKNKIQKDPKFLHKTRENIMKFCKELLDFSKRFKDENLQKKSDQEILDFYNEYIKKYKEMYMWGWVPNALEGWSNLFSKMLENYLYRRLRKLGKENLMGEYFSVLLAPHERSIRQKAEEELLVIADKIKIVIPRPQAEESLTNVSSHPREIPRRPDKIGTARNDIKIYQQKYAWLEFNYEGKALTFDYFLQELNKILKSGQDPKIMLQKIKTQQNEIIEKQEKYAKEIGLDRDKIMNKFFETGRTMQFLKDYRKNILYKSYYFLDFLIRELGRRLNLTPTQVRHILPHEMEAVLLKKKFDANELNERIKYSVLIYRKGKITVLIGNKAKKYIKEHIEEEKILVKKEIRGQCAYSGKAKGKVRLIFTVEDMVKMKEGDILVSPKTDPSLMFAMKKANAIITEQGGITCHAAIVARELKKPCLVGVEAATKILRDGDSILLDANAGIITKI